MVISTAVCKAIFGRNAAGKVPKVGGRQNSIFKDFIDLREKGRKRDIIGGKEG